jgi:hypothetical protein
MKVVKRVNDKVTLGEIVNDFDKYIVITTDGFVLTKAFHNYTWIDILSNEQWGEFDNLSAAVQSVDVKTMYAFDNFTSFGEWVTKELFV